MYQTGGPGEQGGGCPLVNKTRLLTGSTATRPARAQDAYKKKNEIEGQKGKLETKSRRPVTRNN